MKLTYHTPNELPASPPRQSPSPEFPRSDSNTNDSNTSRGGLSLNCDADTMNRVRHDIQVQRLQEALLLTRAHDAISQLLGILAGHRITFDDGQIRWLLREIEEGQPWISNSTTGGDEMERFAQSSTDDVSIFRDASRKQIGSTFGAFGTPSRRALQKCGG